MTEITFPDKDVVVLERKNFQSLLDALSDSRYELLGPTVRDSAIVYERIHAVDELPVGWVDVYEPGKY